MNKIKLFLLTIFMVFANLANAQNIKLYVHGLLSEPHRFALALKSVAEKDGHNISIQAAPGKEFLGVTNQFSKDKEPSIAIISGPALTKHIKDKKANKDDFSKGFIVTYNTVGLTCKKPCKYKSFEDILGNTESKIKIGVTTQLSRDVGQALKDSGVKSILVPYNSWNEASPDLMSNSIDLFSGLLTDRRNDNIEFVTIPEKYGIRTSTWMAVVYKNIPDERFQKWYNDESFVKQIPITPRVKNSNYQKVLNEEIQK